MNESTGGCACGCGTLVKNRWARGHNRRPFRMLSDQERFWASVDKTPTCWIWTGPTRSGYGRYSIGRRQVSAHRFSFEMINGAILEGMEIDHLCRNRACVNPAHLEAVPHSLNVLRCDHHQRRKTHCPAGHPYSGPNLYLYKGRKRMCRMCAKLRDQARRHR